MSLNRDLPDEFSDLAGMLTRAQESAHREREQELSEEAVARRKQRRRRRLITSGVIVGTIAAVVGTYIPLTLLAPIGAVTAEVSAPRLELPAAAALSLPEVGASAISVVGAEQYLGEDGIRAASGGNAARPIASITKLVTALVILDATPIPENGAGPKITFTEADADLYDEYYVQHATVWPLKSGSSVALRDALKVMLVASATNYADALTTHTFGSRSAFRSAAKAWLAANGFTGTTIVEPTGLDPRNLSTPTDLIAIGKMAMAQPVVAELVGISSLSSDRGGWPNTNGLLGVDGVNGIKTGTLDAAGACLLFSAVVDVGRGLQLTVVGVVLGGDNHYQVNNAVRKLLASVKSGFHEVPVLSEGQKLGTYSTPWGDEASIVAVGDASVFTWSDSPIQWTITADDLSVADDGAIIGEMRFVSGDEIVTAPLALKGKIAGPDDWWRLTHPGELLG